MNPIDSFARAHNRHWLTHNTKMTQRIPSAPKVPSQEKSTCQKTRFNPQVMDTFCFHWPELHSYVLVRVLEETIAILPVRSRVAFLYFHHAPLPKHPTPKQLQQALQPVNQSKRMGHMFKGWKHTLITDSSEETDEEVEEIDSTSSLTSHVSSEEVTMETPPSTPKAHSGVTLSDVLDYEPSLKEGWIHAPCTVKNDTDTNSNTIILTTKHAVLSLVARCHVEKVMFMNLVKLKKLSFSSSDDDDRTRVEDDDKHTAGKISSNHITKCLQKKTDDHVNQIQELKIRIEAARGNISYYASQLLDLEQSLELLLDHTSGNINIFSFKVVLNFVIEQLESSKELIQSHQNRISHLQGRVLVVTDFLQSARIKFDKVRTKVLNHAWYPYIYTCKSYLSLLITRLILTVSLLSYRWYDPGDIIGFYVLLLFSFIIYPCIKL